MPPSLREPISQEDQWDTQWDMFTALLGAVNAQLTLARLHDRHLARLGQSNKTSCKCASPQDITH